MTGYAPTCSSTATYVSYYRELAEKLEELTRLVREGSQQNLALVDRLAGLAAEIRHDIGEEAH